MLKRIASYIGIIVLACSAVAAAGFGTANEFAVTAVESGNSLTALEPFPSIAFRDELDLEYARDAAYAVADRYDPALYFVEDLLEELDYDPQAAFLFVRDKIRFDPYRGILRGAEGALGGQAGNAYDRSLLLKRLLEDMGFDARLAYGELSDERCDELLTHALRPPALDFDVEPISRLAGMSPAMQRRMLSRAQRDYGWLRRALDMDFLNAKQKLIDRSQVRNHVWVQARLDSGWQDLDASFPGGEIDKAYAQPSRYALKPEDGDYQMVQIDVVSESLKSGELTESNLLSLELRAAEAVENRVFLTFNPTNPTIGNTLAEKLGAKSGFRPVISLDGDIISGDPMPGISQNSSDDAEFLFGGSGQPELTGLFLDVRTRIPGEHEARSRRTLLDRLPATVRRQGNIEPGLVADVDRIEGIPAVFQGLHQVLVSNGGINAHLAANNIGLAVYFTYTYLSDEELAKELPLDSHMWPLAMLRQAPLVINERLVIEALNDHADLRFLIAEPRVYVMSQEFRTEGGEERIRWFIDLLHDPVHAVAADGLASPEVATRRLWHGVLQAAFETTQLEVLMRSMGASEGLLSASLEVDDAPQLIRSADDPRLPATASPALVNALNRNDYILASRNSLELGAPAWWEIAADGSTRAMLAPDLGGSRWDSTWNNYTRTNPYAKTRITNTDMNPDTLDRKKEMERIRRALKKAEGKADKAYTKNGKHLARANKAKKLPQTRGRVGGTEDTMMQIAAVWMVLPGAARLGLVATATTVVAYMVLSAFL